jgi:hypothetical protein
VELDELARVNGIRDVDWILAGAALHVPPKDRCAGRAVAKSEPAASPGPSGAEAGADAEIRRGQELLDAARSHYDEADFDAALRAAENAGQAFEHAHGQPGVDALRARSHVLAAMAAVGLEDQRRAVAEFKRAIALDPATRLAPDDRSPRLMEAFQLARAGR